VKSFEFLSSTYRDSPSNSPFQDTFLDFGCHSVDEVQKLSPRSSKRYVQLLFSDLRIAQRSTSDYSVTSCCVLQTKMPTKTEAELNAGSAVLNRPQLPYWWRVSRYPLRREIGVVWSYRSAPRSLLEARCSCARGVRRQRKVLSAVEP